MGKPRLFSTAPVSAMQDGELTGLDWRVLLWVGLHDGMSLLKGKGAGCYASNRTLFAEVGCDYAAGCRSLSKLVSRGHLKREQEGRSTRYRVIFGNADSLPTGNISAPERVAGSQDKGPEYVAERPEQAPENLSEQGLDYSSLSERTIFSETEELNSTEVAESSFSRKDTAEAEAHQWALTASLPPNFERLPVGAQVARLEEAFAKLDRDPDRMGSREREQWMEFLDGISETFWEEPHGQQAQRLREEMMQW